MPEKKNCFSLYPGSLISKHDTRQKKNKGSRQRLLRLVIHLLPVSKGLPYQAMLIDPQPRCVTSHTGLGSRAYVGEIWLSDSEDRLFMIYTFLFLERKFSKSIIRKSH